MQLLKLLKQSSTSNPWLETCQEIVGKLEIHSDGWFSHVDYPQSPPSVETTHCFKQLSPELQQRFLSLELQHCLYRAFFNGLLNPGELTEPNSNPLVNDTVHGLNLGFFEELDHSNCGKGYVDRDWEIRHQEDDGSLAIAKNNLTVHINPEIHLVDLDHINNTASVRLPHNLIEDEYYVAVSDVGVIYDTDSEHNRPLINFFLNLDAEGASSVMRTLTSELNSLQVLFALKLPYAQSEYQRHDSGILTIEKNNYLVVGEVLYRTYLQHASFFKPQVPWMTKSLTPGLAIAEVPYDLTSACSNFGLHRCKIVADSILEAGDANKRMDAIVQNFLRIGIDIQHPYLNPGSQVQYRSLSDA
jgi:hypothetical protein